MGRLEAMGRVGSVLMAESYHQSCYLHLYEPLHVLSERYAVVISVQVLFLFYSTC